MIITNVNPRSYDETMDYFDTLKDNCLMWMQDPNYTCEIFYEKFPFLCLPQHSDTALLYLNPFSKWSSLNFVNTDNFNQLVGLDTYQRLIKQELNELHTLANSSAANTKDHFQHYYNNFNQTELNDLKGLTSSINDMLEFLDAKDDCFSLGILSALLANELNHSQLAKQRRKVKL